MCMKQVGRHTEQWKERGKISHKDCQRVRRGKNSKEELCKHLKVKSNSKAEVSSGIQNPTYTQFIGIVQREPTSSG